MKQISLSSAKSFILSQQLLASSKKRPSVKEVIEQIGYVQIDTISVIARAHHHVLWNRIPGYQIDDLKIAEEEDRAIFEFWAHAASYLPFRDYQYTLYRKKQIAAGTGYWFKKDPKVMKFVLDRIKEEGALMARDFKKSDYEKKHLWGAHPIKQALQQLFMEGQIVIKGRRKFQKIFDLPKRVLSASTIKVPNRKDYLKHIIRRDIKAHGIIKPRDIGHLLTGTKKDINSLLIEMTKSGELCEVQIKEKGLDTYFAAQQDITNFQPKPVSDRLYLLSPFDNLVIHRKRIADIFDFDYILECYVTAAKRKVGYFSLPILYRKNLIGQIDLKADRKTKTLWIKNLVWQEQKEISDKIYLAFSKSLILFAKFNECKEIQVAPLIKHKIPFELSL